MYLQSGNYRYKSRLGEEAKFPWRFLLTNAIFNAHPADLRSANFSNSYLCVVETIYILFEMAQAIVSGYLIAKLEQKDAW